MNKRFCSLILMLLAVVSLPVMAAETDEKELGFWVELQAVSSRLPAKAIVWYERELTEKFGLYAFIWKESDGYREYIVGPTYKPFDDVELGCGIGRENMREEGGGTRRSCFADVTRGKFNFHLSVENGRVSGPWKKVTATYAVNEQFGAGVMHETGLGNGPRLEWNVRKNVQLWGAVLRGKILGTNEVLEGKTTLLFAANFSF